MLGKHSKRVDNVQPAALWCPIHGEVVTGFFAAVRMRRQNKQKCFLIFFWRGECFVIYLWLWAIWGIFTVNLHVIWALKRSWCCQAFRSCPKLPAWLVFGCKREKNALKGIFSPSLNFFFGKHFASPHERWERKTQGGFSLKCWWIFQVVLFRRWTFSLINDYNLKIFSLRKQFFFG